MSPVPVLPAAPPPPSPTGTPVMAPSSVPWLLAVLVAVNGGAGFLAANTSNPKVQMGAALVAVTVNGLLGLLSPGLRKKDGAP